MKRNKLYGMVLAASLSTGFTLAPVFTPPSAAQGPSTRQVSVGTLLAGLINVNVTNVSLTDVVDVTDVLNDLQIDILRNAIINIPIASHNQIVLSDVVSDVLHQAVIVVGVLGGTVFYLPL